MTDDLIRGLGYLGLGSRLKRLGERLQKEVQQASAGFDLSLPPGLAPILAALDAHGPLTVNGLARSLGVSQPGVTRSVTRLGGMELVEVRRGASDQRERSVALTDAGRRYVARASGDFWPRVEAAVRDLCGARQESLLYHLDRLEDALAKDPLERRILRAPL